ncbi:ribokinase [Goodfellowiella coeruleoviolacea]|uniref:Ribokinase n=1 Tax=Goodfellowiella coeruleoviolacea TaxID=334858 RepID=A0AAE3KEN3_9PSEU|nr:ribokinase [Goodfellowiella coeruleoviolacea]
MLVVGQVARDLVLLVDEVPEAGTGAAVRSRQEVLGGKGANTAVALSQLGVSAGLLGVVGSDEVAERLLAQARADGVDVSAVVRRADTGTGLIVNVLDRHARWRYLEHLPAPVLLTEADVLAEAARLARAGAVVVQLQQPSAAALAAARCARRGRARVVLDGAPTDARDAGALLAEADVVRADPREAELFTGVRVDGVDAAVRAGRELLGRGPRLVALGVEGEGNVFVWGRETLFLPLLSTEVVDTTGAGDAFTAGLTAALVRGARPAEAARLAVASAGLTVARAGGRPCLSAPALRDPLRRLARHAERAGRGG